MQPGAPQRVGLLGEQDAVGGERHPRADPVCREFPKLQLPRFVREGDKRFAVGHKARIAVTHTLRSGHLDKPPLLYWLVMASYDAFGVHDWSARLIACAASFLVVLVTFAWGKRVVGVRAALCTDAETARGARTWNDANVLVMDLMGHVTVDEAPTILDAWFQTEADPSEAGNISQLEA